jgi:hypothetical protein
VQPPAGRSDAGTQAASPGLLERARRLGPLPHSALGIRPEERQPDAEGVAGWVAGTLDGLWEDAGRPDPFTAVHVAAGDGSTAAALLARDNRPSCLKAMRLVLVEGDELLRDSHRQRLPVEEPALLLGPVTPPDDPDDDPLPATGIGPLVTSLAELPVVRGWCVIVATRWLSRFPVDVFEWRSGRWNEVRLAAGGGSELREITVELDPERAERMDMLVRPQARVDGARFAGHGAACAWLRAALAASESGWVVAADAWSDTTVAFAAGEALPVALDQLSAVRRPDSSREDGPGGLRSVRWRIG